MSTTAALNKITAQYLEADKKVHLSRLPGDLKRLLDLADEIIEVKLIYDSTYKVVSDATHQINPKANQMKRRGGQPLV